MRGFTGLGERTERLLADLAEVATTDEFNRQLGPVLDGLRQRCVALINEAARLAAVARPRQSRHPNHRLERTRSV